MDYVALLAEITNDPLGRGYAAMGDTAVSADINSRYRPGWKGLVPTYDVLSQLLPADIKALTPAELSVLQMVLSLERIDTNSANVRNLLGVLFPAGTQSRTNLMNYASALISRADELGLGFVTYTDVGIARRGGA